MENSMKVLDAQLYLTLWPHGLQSTRLLCSWNSSGKNTGVGSHSLLQGNFPTWPRGWTSVSCIAGRFFTFWETREAHGKQYEVSSKDTKKNNNPSELSYYTTVPLLGFYLKKTSSKRYVHPIFAAVLFIIAKILNKLSVHH